MLSVPWLNLLSEFPLSTISGFAAYTYRIFLENLIVGSSTSL
jgi:hypothetical protein